MYVEEIEVRKQKSALRTSTPTTLVRRVLRQTVRQNKVAFHRGLNPAAEIGKVRAVALVFALTGTDIACWIIPTIQPQALCAEAPVRLMV
jgi:hypothetical protein